MLLEVVLKWFKLIMRNIWLIISISTLVYGSEKLFCDYDTYGSDTCEISDQIIADPLITLPSVNRSVTKLYIEGLQVTLIPENIAKTFSQITVLQVTCTSVSSVTELSFRKIPDLSELQLSDNEIKSIEPNAFKHLKNLETLDLSNNSVASLPENVFDNLKHLKVLRLSRNKIESITKRLFLNLVTLEKLSVHHNSIKGIAENIFSSNINLEYIWLNHNEISFLPYALFDVLSHLADLDLKDNVCVNKRFDSKELLKMMKTDLHDCIINFHNFAIREMKKLQVCKQNLKKPVKKNSVLEHVVFRLFFGVWT